MEILLAMTILAMVSGGFFTAFSVSRRIHWLSETQIMVQNHCQEMMEGFRSAVAGDIASGPLKGLTLQPGYYVDTKMPNPPNSPSGAAPTRLAALNFPPDLQRFQTAAGDGVYLYVERADEKDANGNPSPGTDYDGDGLKGVSFNINNNGKTDLRRVRVRVQWTVPSQ